MAFPLKIFICLLLSFVYFKRQFRTRSEISIVRYFNRKLCNLLLGGYCTDWKGVPRFTRAAWGSLWKLRAEKTEGLRRDQGPGRKVEKELGRKQGNAVWNLSLRACGIIRRTCLCSSWAERLHCWLHKGFFLSIAYFKFLQDILKWQCLWWVFFQCLGPLQVTV